MAYQINFEKLVSYDNAEDESFTKNVLGRITWLDNLVFGLVDQESKIYLSKYGE